MKGRCELATEFGFAGTIADTVLTKAVELYAPDLHKSGTCVGLRFCSNPDAPPLQHGGYPAFAKVSIVPLKWRLKVPWDAVIDVDAVEYSDAEEPSRLALFHHELKHLSIQSKKNRESLERNYKEECSKAEQEREPTPEPPVFWKIDSLGRPKLKSTKGDWNVGDGFFDVIATHGPAAIEAINIVKAYNMMNEALEKYRETHNDAGTVAFKRKAN